MPPYKFAELERLIADKRAAGIDVISLGIGDPDMPTYDHVAGRGRRRCQREPEVPSSRAVPSS
jgi:LL-diaminopimelate aminotransferase